MIYKKMNRYNRHIILPEIGEKGQQQLLNSKVLVVGAGGLGCPILQYLCAAGVGTLGVIDDDVVDESNLQRQVLYGSSSLGKSKALAAKKRLEDLNNTITIHAYAEKLTHTNVIELFTQYDLIVDGTDNFFTRYLINDAAIITKKPLVYGAIYKFEGQVAVFNYNNGPSYRCLFPNPPKADTIPNCSEIGVLGVLPGIIGTMQTNEVLKILLGLGTVLSGKILYYNALTMQSNTIAIQKSEHADYDTVVAQFQKQEVQFSCVSEIQEITIAEALQKQNVQFIDVREIHETPKITTLDYINIPLNQLEQQLEIIDTAKETILFCQSGIRSKKAVTILQKYHITNCYSLKEGAQSLQTELTIIKTN